jgi:hypothetical protein
MLSTILFLVLLSIGFIQAIPAVDESCKVQIYNWEGPCAGLIIVPKTCTSATADLSTTKFESCDRVDLTWSYPMNNLTIIVETPYTKQHQPYTINIDNINFKLYPLPIYRIEDGHERQIKTTADVIVEKSDSNYQVIMKLQAESTIGYYLSFFRYNVIKS